MRKVSIDIKMPAQSGNEAEFFSQSTPPNMYAFKAHIHNAVELLYVREGSYTITSDNVRYDIKEGDLIMFCSGAIHYGTTNGLSENSYYVIKISPSFFIDFARSNIGAEYAMRFALGRKEDKCLWHKEELEGSDIKRILDALIKEGEEQKYASEVAIKLKIMELLLALLRTSGQSPAAENDSTSRLIYSVMCYVQQKYAEDIDEKELAKSYGISYSYFSRSFKKITGVTFRNYLNKTRITKAEQLLFLKRGSVSEVALTCGYNSVSYFISVYRKITGKTPHQALKEER